MTTATQIKPAHNIGPITGFPEREVVSVEIDGRTFGLLRKGDEVFIFANRCPHHGAPMCHAQVSGTMRPSDRNEYDYDLDGLIIKCPWHAYEFDVRTGESMGGIIASRLMVFQTDIRDGDVLVTLQRKSSARQ